LLGGSFNPAHGGHLRLSLFALKRLALDEIWWLVSPQNPLKPVAGMVPMRERLKKATAVATHPRIHATDIEARLGTRYTVDILERLTPRYPSVRFVWLMGADNLAQVDRWHRWQALFSHVAVAVIDRPGQTPLQGPAAQPRAPTFASLGLRIWLSRLDLGYSLAPVRDARLNA
jgi:nicotinate-nucleotide adenylyltransferase